MRKKNNLQKFTDNKTLINNVLEKKNVLNSDIEKFTPEQTNELLYQIGDKINNLKGTDRDKFIKKVDAILSESTKNQLWEGNHTLITQTVSNLMLTLKRMPTKNEISDKCGLSRQTVHKHLKDFNTDSLYFEHLNQFKILIPKVLNKVYDLALKGDLNACKLYFNMLNNTMNTPTNVLVQNQNNYIQINKTVLSQSDIAKLPPEKLIEIEAILNTINQNQILLNSVT